jgi:hypothetical protein
MAATQAQKIACPKVRVDPQGKKAKVPRPVLEHAADQLDVLEVADGIHLDLLPLFGGVGVFSSGSHGRLYNNNG